MGEPLETPWRPWDPLGAPFKRRKKSREYQRTLHTGCPASLLKALKTQFKGHSEAVERPSKTLSKAFKGQKGLVKAFKRPSRLLKAFKGIAMSPAAITPPALPGEVGCVFYKRGIDFSIT